MSTDAKALVVRAGQRGFCIGATISALFSGTLISNICFIFAVLFVNSLLKSINVMLEKEFKYYLDQQAQLVEKFNGKYLVIKGEEVIGVYDAEDIAFFETEKKHEPGTFLIQFCESGDSSYTQVYHSRVSFA